MSASPGSNPATGGIAAFVAGLTYARIPSEVIARIQLLILDALGCALFGTSLEWSRILLATLARLDISRGSGVWGTGERLSAPHAALVNGTLVHSFELDDVHRAGVLHVGAVTLPALFAVAELKGGMSGRDFLTAAVAGYEIGPRVGLCMGPEHIGQGPAQSGLYGALLAEAGFTGITDVFESPYGGFCTTFSRSQDRFNLAELTAGLGERFETMNVALKFYACVGSNHTALDAIRAIQARRPFVPEEVDKIVVHGSQATVDHVGWPYRPHSLTAAQMNLPFCIATLLIEGDVFVEQFSAAVVADPRRMGMAGKVEVRHDPAITARGAKLRHMVRIEVHLADGTRHDETVEAPRGSERRFASEADVVAKFAKLSRHRLSDRDADRIRDLVLGCDKLADIGELVRALARPS